MRFLSVCHSDVGIKKDTNQDAVLIREADTDYGRVLFAVVCDGMGGLAKGEVASAVLIRAFSEWFESVFPDILYHKRDAEGMIRLELENALDQVVQDVNRKIAAYAAGHHCVMGTTAAAFLLAEGRYYILNVGDSRVYRIGKDAMTHLTKDQTYVQNEIDQGRMSPAEARVHPQRNALLQCVGASEVLIPEFGTGQYSPGELYMVCSDGFRHEIAEEEFCKIILNNGGDTEDALRSAAVYCTELNKQRKEKDNISVIFIRVCQE